MKTNLILTQTYALMNLVGFVGICALVTSPRVSAENTVQSTTLGETNTITPEISTEQLEKILADRSEPVLDVRFAQECNCAYSWKHQHLRERDRNDYPALSQQSDANRALLQWAILRKEQTSFR